MEILLKVMIGEWGRQLHNPRDENANHWLKDADELMDTHNVGDRIHFTYHDLDTHAGTYGLLFANQTEIQPYYDIVMNFTVPDW